MLLTDRAKIHNAIAALADAVAHELEIAPHYIDYLTSELKVEIAKAINEVESGVSPDMVGESEEAEDAPLNPPPGDFSGFTSA